MTDLESCDFSVFDDVDSLWKVPAGQFKKMRQFLVAQGLIDDFCWAEHYRERFRKRVKSLGVRTFSFELGFNETPYELKWREDTTIIIIEECLKVEINHLAIRTKHKEVREMSDHFTDISMFSEKYDRRRHKRPPLWEAFENAVRRSKEELDSEIESMCGNNSQKQISKQDFYTGYYQLCK